MARYQILDNGKPRDLRGSAKCCGCSSLVYRDTRCRLARGVSAQLALRAGESGPSLESCMSVKVAELNRVGAHSTSPNSQLSVRQR